MKIFDKETFDKMLNYAFLKIQEQNARKFDAAVCFFSLPFLKIDVTTLRKHICEKRCIK